MTPGKLRDVILQMIKERRFTAAVEACDKALAGQLSLPQRLTLLQDKARALVAEDGRWNGPAISCLKEALQLAETGTEDHGRVLCAFTAAHAQLGSLSLLRDHRRMFLEDFRKLTTPVMQRFYAHVEYNLAMGFHLVEDLTRADDAYAAAQVAYEALGESPQSPVVLDIKVNQLDVYQELAEQQKDKHYQRLAKALMDEIFPHLAEDEFGALMRLRRSVHALLEGDLTEALLWVESGLGHRPCDVPTRAALTLTRAKIAKANGDLTEAHDVGLEAMRLAVLAHCVFRPIRTRVPKESERHSGGSRTPCPQGVRAKRCWFLPGP